jgi:hypothetical protein
MVVSEIFWVSFEDALDHPDSLSAFRLSAGEKKR